jgi:Sugar-transfer associated ATP-grasp
MEFGKSAMNYLKIARQIAARWNTRPEVILPKMVMAKTLYGISATEFALYGMSSKPLGQISHFLTKKHTTKLFSKINPQSDKWRVDDKLAFHRICEKAGIPTPRIHCILSNRSATDIADFQILKHPLELMHVFGHMEDVRIFLKPRNDSLGTGTRYMRIRDKTAFDIENKPMAMEPFIAELLSDMQRDDYLVQSFVTPHPEVVRLGSGPALGTMRLDTYTESGRVQLLFGLLRIPCGRNVSDNFLAGRSGNLIAALDVETGEIRAAYGRRNNSFPNLLERFEANPETSAAITGQFVPGWADLRGRLEGACLAFAELPILGWDVAVSPEGPVFIEANSNPDIIGEQVTSGRGARLMLRPVYAHLGAST